MTKPLRRPVLTSYSQTCPKRGEQLQLTDIVFTVTTRLDLSKLKREVDKIDPDAFMVFGEIKDTKGGMIKKRPLKK